ncbi:MAG: thiamine pyrophosphate-dependent dehydrogenase E1 component subunit alpha [Woeseiaceae bacterium]
MTAPSAGNPRTPEPVPLEHARDLDIRQVMDQNGEVKGNLDDPELGRDDVRMLYETMVLLRAIDERGWKLQRSGRIAFWIPLRGQEAVQVAATHAMEPTDWIFREHRTMSPWLMRGASLELLFAQLFGAVSEPQKGRRLPCLMGNRAVNMVQGPTQVGSFISHACGVAWAAKLKGSDVKVLGTFGDGATSRGEFHSAMNFAGIHRPPVIFLCVNNSWAVSTPLDCQTASTEFAAKGNAYEVPNVRVDGNDPLAVYAVTKQARADADVHGPTLVEAITWRQGFHTSSDNPDLYRLEKESELWKPWDPVSRTRKYLQRAGWWDDAEEIALLERCAERIQSAVEAAESMEIPGPESQFDDVFASSNWMLDEQRDRLLAEVRGEDNPA